MFVFSELGPPSDLFIKHQRNSFSFLPLHQLPIATHQHPVVCFWGFFNIFMSSRNRIWRRCGQMIDHFRWRLFWDFQEGWRSKLNGQRKPPQQHSAGVLHSWWFKGFLLFALPLKYVYAIIKLLTYPRHTMPNYTDLSGTSTLQQFVFSCVTPPPPRWTPAVHWYVAHSIVVQAKDSRTKRANATRSQTLHILLSVTYILCLVTISSRLSLSHSGNGLQSISDIITLCQLEASGPRFTWVISRMRHDTIVRCKKSQYVTGRSELSVLVVLACPCWFKDLLLSLPQMTNNQKWHLYHFTNFC